jgi:RNA methyltransferase, TrmH family
MLPSSAGRLFPPLTPSLMRAIASRQNPMVADFRELAAHPDPAGERVLLDGAHLVREALSAGLRFETAVVASSRLVGRTEESHLAEMLASLGVDIASADERAFGAVSPTRQPSGIAAIAHRTAAAPDDLVRSDTALILVAAEIQDPGNVGGLIRAAEAGGATGVLVTAGSANPFSWKSLRGSMGSALRLPVVTGLDLDAAMDALEARAVASVAALPRSGVDPDTLDWSGRVAVWVGAEGQGLPVQIVRRCPRRVTIPMAEPVESLNAAVAAGVLVYTARRHRS